MLSAQLLRQDCPINKLLALFDEYSGLRNLFLFKFPVRSLTDTRMLRQKANTTARASDYLDQTPPSAY